MQLKVGVIVFALLSIGACESSQPDEFHHTILTFGTLLDITLSDVTPELAQTTFDLLDNDYRDYHNAWTPWQDSDLSKINDAIRNHKKIIPSASVLPLIQQSIALSRQSQGLFNPAIGNLINLWQFHKHEDPDIKPPAETAIQEYLLQKPSMSQLRFEGAYLVSRNNQVQLNFGAFAKGYAIDLSFEKLKKLGVKNAIINAGGDLRVSGTQGTRLWNIGIQHPRNDGIIASVAMRDNESIFTSGDYERHYTHNNRRYHHILDPSTGYPTQGTSSVTVIHPNAAIADAAATALFVAGAKRWHSIAKNMNIHYVMLIEESGVIHMNPKMANRIKIKPGLKPSIVLSQPL